jgi:geranylgeranyl diphosphate synthase type I
VWGKAQGINAGDALFALSELALLRLSEQAVPPASVVAACQLFNQTCLALTEGQHLDLSFENRTDVSITEYLAMIERKTAALVACACEMGGLIATASASAAAAGLDHKRHHLRAFGRHLGLAFQMQDDILGVWGDPVITGKPTGADVTWRKKTLPILHGLEHSAELRAMLSPASPSPINIPLVTRLLEGTGSRTYTERMAQRHYGQALEALAKAELHDPAATALYELTQDLLKRVR